MTEMNEEKHPSIIQSAMVMAVATTLSKITGFARTWAMAFALGNTVLASSYQIAFNLPSMLYELVAGGILTTAFLPVYLSVKNRAGDKEAWSFFSNLCTIALIALSIMVIAATVFAPQVIATQTFMTGGESADQAVFFFRFFAIQVLFLGLGALFGGVLNAHRRYFWPNVSSVFNNLAVIITLFGYVPLSKANPELAKYWLAIGTTVGSFFMMACLLPDLKKTGICFKPHINLKDPSLKEVVRIAVPVIVFTIANLVAVSFRNAFALDAAPNGPSTIQYAWMWYQLPYGIISAALSVAVFTELADLDAKGDADGFKSMLLQGLRLTLFLILPFASCLMVLAEPLVSLYHAGEFTSDDVQLVSQVLFWWAMTLPLYSIYMYLYRVFSALKDLVLLTQVDVVLRVVNIACYVVLTSGLGSFEGLGLIGIPISDTIFYLLMNASLIFLLQRRVGSIRQGGIILFVVKTSVSGVVLCLLGAAIRTTVFSSVTGIAGSLLTVCSCGMVMLVAYILLSLIMGIPEARKLTTKFKRQLH